jgi:NAD(P)-dependent dehydrogenase (short-subunit alcohol dehydrogenase family)
MDVLDQSQMNKVMIATGGSRGIGAATASLAADQGYAICLTYLHNQEAANRIVDSIEQSGGRAIAVAASKGAIETMTIGLAKEVANEGIRVNAVRPGVIYTDIHASGGKPNRVDRVKAFIPMKRGGQVIEVARAILWLLSDEASYTIGSFIDVAGGA